MAFPGGMIDGYYYTRERLIELVVSCALHSYESMFRIPISPPRNEAVDKRHDMLLIVSKRFCIMQCNAPALTAQRHQRHALALAAAAAAPAAEQTRDCTSGDSQSMCNDESLTCCIHLPHDQYRTLAYRDIRIWHLSLIHI